MLITKLSKSKMNCVQNNFLKKKEFYMK